MSYFADTSCSFLVSLFRPSGLIAFFTFLICLFTAQSASVTVYAAPVRRLTVTQRGDFVLIGNTLAQECAAGTPAPVVGTVGNCGSNITDSAPDVFWRADAPALGSAQADTTVTLAQARSTAALSIPAGAQVTHAFLYWAATLPAAGFDNSVALERPGAGGFSQTVTASSSYQSANNSYSSVADITSLVQANGTGIYRVSGVDSDNIVNLNSSNNFAGWWMVVLYRLNTDPVRQLTVSDGLDNVSNGIPQNATLSGFMFPSTPSTAKLGVVTLEGDNTVTGDSLSFGGTLLSDALNPATNFFNGSHSSLGTAVSTTGDLPQTTGTAGSMSGLDLDVIDVTSHLSAGQTSATIQASSTGDVYFLATFMTSIVSVSPLLAASGNGITISSGDTTPSAGDNTDFGSIDVNNGTVTRNFTLTNTGSATLNISPINLTGANAADFSTTTQPSATVAAGGSTTFTVTFNPSATGTRAATVSISSNDPNAALYSFAIQGNGTMAPTAALVSISGRVTSITGRGIMRVRLSLIDSSGEIRTAMTTSFGYYQFNDVQTGATYILSASGRNYTFSQPVQILNVTEETNQINFIARKEIDF